MSIYLEFPAIEHYPLYTDPYRSDDQIYYPEETEKVIVEPDTPSLHDYLTLKVV